MKRIIDGLLLGLGFSLVFVVVLSLTLVYGSGALFDYIESNNPFSPDSLTGTDVIVEESRLVVRDGRIVALGAVKNPGHGFQFDVGLSLDLFASDGTVLDTCYTDVELDIPAHESRTFKIVCSSIDDVAESSVANHAVTVSDVY